MRPLFLFLIFTLLLPGLLNASDSQTAPLFDFRQPDTLNSWKINVFKDHPAGGRGRTTFEPIEDPEKGPASRLIAESAGRFNLISPELDQPEDGSLLGFQLEYRTNDNSDRLDLVLCDTDGNLHSARLPSTEGAWEIITLTSFPDSRKGTPPLNLQKLRKIYIRGSGEINLSLLSIRYVVGERQLPLSAIPRSLTVIPEVSAAPVLDGTLRDPVWAQSTAIHEPGAILTPKEDADYPTEVRLLRHGTTLYIGALFSGESDPVSDNGSDDHNVWKDSCFEVFLKPDLAGEPGYQLIVNSRNVRQDYRGDNVTWNGSWQSAVAKDENGWSVELAINLRELSPEWNPKALWRWNFIRTVAIKDHPAKYGIAYRAGLAEMKNVLTAPSPLLAFSPAEDHASSRNLSLIKHGPGEYDLTFPSLENATHLIRIFRKVDDRTDLYIRQTASTASPVPITLEQSGIYQLEVQSETPDGLETRLVELFHSQPVEVSWDDIVLHPTPQKIDIGDESLLLSQISDIRQSGEGSSFPASHLREQIERRYGPLNGRDQEQSPSILLDYEPTADIPEEGYHLTVSDSGVVLRASSDRGMYYAVRTLLDLITASSPNPATPQIRHVICEDWPRNQRRALYYSLGASRYQLPTDVEAVKDFIYKQVAGGRYNLFFIMVGNGYEYKAAPKLRIRNQWTRQQLEEVLDFARKHFVEVAPAGNSPGHGGWLIRSYREFGDEGDLQAFDLGNRDAINTLLACYAELIDLFKPRYFHSGGDEFRPRWTENSRSAEERRSLILAHWKELNQFFKSKGVRMIIWDDMLSPQWNGGPPLMAAEILKDLPRDIIPCSWSDRGLDNPPSLYDELGFEEHWRVMTSFDTQRADRAIGWWKDYDALGMGLFTSWPWSAFSHQNYITHTKYTSAAMHLNTLLLWNPDSLARGAETVLANEGPHWMRAMSPAAFGSCSAEITALPLGKSSATVVPSLLKPVRKSFARGVAPQSPYLFQPSAGGPLFATAGGAPAVVPVNSKAAGLIFLHSTGTSKDELPELHKQFRFETNHPRGLKIGEYQIRYTDGATETTPVLLGYNVHFYDSVPLARVLLGSPALFTGAQIAGIPALPAAWVLEWRNPRPDVAIQEVRLVAENRYSPLILLGASAVGVIQ